MSYKKSLIRLLDRPGGRGLLGKIGTRVVRRSSGGDIEIVYRDGFWVRRAGPHFLPDGPEFDYTYEDFSRWTHQTERYVADAKDYWLRHYEPREGDVIVDVGAGRGEDTFAFSNAVGKSGRVIAIEAHPLSFAMLKRFCQLNGLENVTALHYALMDVEGSCQVLESKSSWAENEVRVGRDAGIRVPATTLGRIFQQESLYNVAFLKMNIEGAERYALPGMSSVMQRLGQICVACHDFRGEHGDGERFRTRSYVERFLTDHGFEVSTRPNDPRDYVRDHLFGINNSAKAAAHNRPSTRNA